MTTTATDGPAELASPDQMTDPGVLAGVLGPIVELRRSPKETTGFSGASFERIRVWPRGAPMRSLVLKRVPLGRDWISIRTEDAVGRTAAFLAAPELCETWQAFHCPYLAFAADDREIVLLMEDLGPHLFPDERTPLPRSTEDALLGALAGLHARFWESPVLDADWLAPMAARLDILAPGDWSDGVRAAPPPALRDGLERGWSAALRLLPAALRSGLTMPGAELAGLWRGLPRTLLHGDTKVGNFALMPDGRVSAFDWSLVGAGSPGAEMGWYLAMNATRLSRTKEDVLERYRHLLEKALGRVVPPPQWKRMETLAIWTGARALLWSKALALESGREGVEEEWGWWENRLERTPLP